jgi:hypothetical protein
MRAITKILIALLAVALLMSVIPPVYAESYNAQSTGSQQNSPTSLSDLSKLNAPSGQNFLNFNKLVNELAKTERQVVKYFEKRGAQAVGTSLVDKTLTRNLDGTWHVTIYVTVPAGLTANVYDYMTNLVPIAGTFTPIQPDVVRDGYVEYDGLSAGSYVLQFDARQTLPGFVADQVFINAYAFGGPGGFISSDRGVGWWFDI